MSADMLRTLQIVVVLLLLLLLLFIIIIIISNIEPHVQTQVNEVITDEMLSTSERR